MCEGVCEGVCVKVCEGVCVCVKVREGVCDVSIYFHDFGGWIVILDFPLFAKLSLFDFCIDFHGLLLQCVCQSKRV